MSDPSTFAQQIRKRFEARTRARFPGPDIKKLIPNDESALALLHGRIEMFVSGIAGYASSADRLEKRPKKELQAALDLLSKSFFDRHQEYAGLRKAVTPELTPDLYR